MRRADIAVAARRTIRQGFARVGLSVERFPNPLGPGYHLVNLMRAYDVDCVLDVGANEGQFGAMLRESGYSGPIVSFEPLSVAHEKLQARAVRMRRGARVAWHSETGLERSP